MKILFILLCIVFLLGGCKKELKEKLVFSSPAEPLIIFSNLSDTWIDFDFDKNEWIYQGNLDEIVKEIQKYYKDMFQPTGIILIEIVRQLRKQEFR